MHRHKPIDKPNYLFLLFLLCLSINTSISQPENRIFRNISSVDGLPTTTVTDVTQDALGFIWIGTWDGVFRYDGATFEKMAFSGRYVEADKSGGVWVSEEGGNMVYYDSNVDSLKNYKIPSAFRFGSVSIDDSGGVWVTSKAGIAFLNTQSGQFELDVGQKDGRVFDLSAKNNGQLWFLYRNNGPILLGRRDEDGTYHYESLPEDQNNSLNVQDGFNNVLFVFPIDSLGTLLLGNNGWAIRKTDTSKWDFHKPDKPESLTFSSDAILDTKGNIWLNQENALSKINIETGESTTYVSDSGDPNSVAPLDGVGHGSNLFIDRQGILWITRYSYGISRLNLFDSDFGLLKDPEGKPFIDILSSLEEKDGSFWIGSRITNDGLIHFNPKGNIIKRYGTKSFDSPSGRTVSTELSHPFPWAIAQSSDGSIWVGTGSPGPHSGGLNRIRPGSNLITRFKHDPDDTSSLLSNWIFKLLVDGSDRIWVLTNRGICIINPDSEEITSFTIPGIDSLSDSDGLLNYVPVMVTVDGNIILSTNRNHGNFGLPISQIHHFIVNHENLKTTLIPAQFEEAPFSFPHEDHTGKIWIVFNDGFGYLDSNYKSIKKRFYLDKLNLPASQIVAINSDKEGYLWLSTDNGIFRFDPRTESFVHFGFNRGLQGNLFLDLANYKGPSGKIYFGGNSGINIFNPSSIMTSPYPPEMIITDIELDGKSVQFVDESGTQKPVVVAKKITIDPYITTISIDFAAIHFAGDGANQYKYQLLGFDKEWRDGGIIGNATYTNISHGSYTFQIKGGNCDGVWSDGTKSIDIIILPQWWQTRIAYVSYFLLVCISIYFFNGYMQRRIIAKEREKSRDKELIQAKEIEKAYKELKSTQSQLIQSEKMASLGELTAGIAHEIQNPLNFVNNFSEVSTELLNEMKGELEKGDQEEAIVLADDVIQNLEKITHHGKRADSIVKGMLQHSRASSGEKVLTDINALCDEYLRLAYHGLRAKDKSFNADYKMNFDKNLPQLKVVPQDIGRVLLNLINNAFYAVNEKKQMGNLKGYEPLVTVSTQKMAPFEEGMREGIQISVKDNGNGIPKDIVDKIFQPFYTSKPTGQGTGLGLSLAYDIVKAHHGEIRTESTSGEGSNFTIIIQIAP